MNREILFRGKCTDNRKTKPYGQWVYGDVTHFKSTGLFENVNYDYYDVAHEDVDQATVGQYTGLTDKNGVKIWEGDIVRTKTRIATVEWQLAEAGFMYHFNDEFIEWLPMSNFDAPDIEVVGNIHDNSEAVK